MIRSLSASYIFHPSCIGWTVCLDFLVNRNNLVVREVQYGTTVLTVRNSFFLSTIIYFLEDSGPCTIHFTHFLCSCSCDTTVNVTAVSLNSAVLYFSWAWRFWKLHSCQKYDISIETSVLQDLMTLSGRPSCMEAGLQGEWSLKLNSSSLLKSFTLLKPKYWLVVFVLGKYCSSKFCHFQLSQNSHKNSLQILTHLPRTICGSPPFVSCRSHMI